MSDLLDAFPSLAVLPSGSSDVASLIKCLTLTAILRLISRVRPMPCDFHALLYVVRTVLRFRVAWPRSVALPCALVRIRNFTAASWELYI